MNKTIKKWYGVSAGVLMVAGVVMGQESDREIVVSATRYAADAQSVASSVTVITSEQIERTQSTTILDVLRRIPGVHIGQNGGLGTAADIFIRGGDSDQVLVTIDGVEVNDPISPGRAPYLANLDLQNVDRIEVLRGGQSGLYGSDAVGGVISITTKKGSGDPRAYLSIEAGSFNTIQEAAGLSGGHGILNYAVSVSRVDSDGISAADEDDGNSEEDGFEHTSASIRLGVDPSQGFGVDFMARYLDSENEFDASGGAGGDATGNVSERESLYLRTQATAELAGGDWRQVLGVSMAMHDRSSKSAFGTTEFDSQLLKVDWQHDVAVGDANVLTAGVEFETEEGKTTSVSRKSADTASLFIQDRAQLGDAFILALSGRWDDHEEFGDELTYRVGPVYTFRQSGTRVKATYGTGFKAPSLYQLYAPAASWGPVGNQDLDPEDSTGWDAGIEQDVSGDRAMIGVTYFANTYRDLIVFSGSGYANESEAETYGVEVYSVCRITKGLAASLNYTFLETENKDTGEELIRRPDHRLAAGLDYDWQDRARVGISVLYVGERDDDVFDPVTYATTRTEMDAYTVVNVAASYDVNERVHVFGRVENLFDEDYQEATGYGTPGVSGYGGIRLSL